MDTSWLDTALTVLGIAIPAIVAITFHEAAHGWVASKLGDDTALRLGRVTFNPLAHVDPVGTVALPALMYLSTGFVFGWAKPVPVDFSRLRRPRADMVKVALAGPGINLLLALLATAGLALVPSQGGEVAFWFGTTLINAVAINTVLMLFNLIPLPPLDGGRVAVGILPHGLAWRFARLERYGLPILIGVLFLLPLLGREMGVTIEPLGWLLGPAIDGAIRAALFLSGHG